MQRVMSTFEKNASRAGNDSAGAGQLKASPRARGGEQRSALNGAGAAWLKMGALGRACAARLRRACGRARAPWVARPSARESSRSLRGAHRRFSLARFTWGIRGGLRPALQPRWSPGPRREVSSEACGLPAGVAGSGCGACGRRGGAAAATRSPASPCAEEPPAAPAPPPQGSLCSSRPKQKLSSPGCGREEVARASRDRRRAEGVRRSRFGG